MSADAELPVARDVAGDRAAGARPRELGAGFVARLGLAIGKPQWALAIAGDRRFAGRSGSDYIAVILMMLLATQLRALVGAVWIGGVVGFGFGMRGVMHVLTRALTIDLGFLVLGALVLWLAAGPKRNLGRAFDLACVAALPLLLVDLGATVIVRALDTSVPLAVGWVLAAISWGWTGALLALAIRPARVASGKLPLPPRPVIARGARVGWIVVAVAVVGIAVQTRWIVENLDGMRPVSSGEPAPAFALRVVGPGGELGPPITLASMRGKITIIDFWATWCGPCLKAMPELARLAQAANVQVLAVNLDDPKAARALFDQQRYGELMNLVADDGEVSERYGVSSIPHTVLIDREGLVRAVSRGTGLREIEQLIEQIRK